MTKAHGSTLYLGSKDMDLMIELLESHMNGIPYSPASPVHKQASKLRDKLRSKQYHPTRKK